MKLFKCTHCGQLVYFENTFCTRCGYPLGYLAEDQQLYALDNHPETISYFLITENNKKAYQYCANHQYGVCNWMVEKESPNVYCSACNLNGIIPNLSQPEYLLRWNVIENAKHRLVYALQCLKLPLVNKYQDPEKGLQFDFLASDSKKVLTGHDDGLITINIAEADDIEREMARRAMDEVYRTLLGHFRHEVGHYYWDRLIDNSPYINRYREIFGDERDDYEEALKRHYKNGAPVNWNVNFISAYASSHPWEDWAESWAHYMHIMDTLETAYAFGISVHPFIAPAARQLEADINNNPYEIQSFERILEMWLPLTFAMNSLNRSMGVRDPYPFIISGKVAEKLSFIHEVCHPAGRLPGQKG